MDEDVDSSESPRKKSKPGKSGGDRSGVDSQAPVAPGGNLTVGLALTPAAGRDWRVRSAIQPDALLPTALPVPTAATPEEFRVEWNSSRETASPGELAFALRLKPLASTTSSVPDAAVPTGGEIPVGGLASLLPAKAENQSGAGSQGGNRDSSGGGSPAAHKNVLPDPLVKAAHAEKAETPAFVETANAPAPTEQLQAAPLVQSLVQPLVHGTTSPIQTAGEASPKSSAPAAASVDIKDGPVIARPAQEISLQISGSGDRKVDVRLVERAGEVHVSVRTPDVTLAHEMQQELGSLTGKLAQSGYGTEQFTPLSAGSANLSDPRNSSQNQDHPSHNGQGSQQGGSGQQQQPQDEPGKRPAWVEEMENSLAQRQTNRSTSWLQTR